MRTWIHSLLVLFVSNIVSAASVEARHGGDDDDCNCLNRREANDIVARFTSIAIKINTTIVDQTVTEDFKFFSDNQAFLEGRPYSSETGIPTVNNKTDLIAQQTFAQQPGTPVIPESFNILQTYFTCKEIIFRWRFTARASGTLPGSTAQAGDAIEYAGIDILVLARNSKLVKIAYSEWNSGELLFDLGTRTCFQKNNASACA